MNGEANVVSKKRCRSSGCSKRWGQSRQIVLHHFHSKGDAADLIRGQPVGQGRVCSGGRRPGSAAGGTTLRFEGGAVPQSTHSGQDVPPAMGAGGGTTEPA